jgi:4-hydroxy-tetrahydrodipicolinate reductase
LNRQCRQLQFRDIQPEVVPIVWTGNSRLSIKRIRQTGGFSRNGLFFSAAEKNFRATIKERRMGIPVIVMGAAGRMGATMVRLVGESADLDLMGAVERMDRLSTLVSLPCPVAPEVSKLPTAIAGAVIVDFTAPSVSLPTARTAAKTGAAHVIGTTGFSGEEQAELRDLAVRTPIFWSPNMSVGVNVLLRILPELARLLGDSYDMEMTEIHHNKKKDAPSGTALRLAEALAGARDWPFSEVACCHREGIIGERPAREIGIQSLRGGDVVGVHTVYFLGAGERIELTHQAHSRENFANGALRAVRFLHGQKPGRLYTMQDILQ